MKQNVSRVAALLMSAVLAFALCACTGKKPDNGSVSPATLPPEEHTDYPVADIPYGKTIATAANYANTVNGYFTDSGRGVYRITNLRSRVDLDLQGTEDDSPAAVYELTNSQGVPYISRTMDAYIVGDDGIRLFAGDNPARANLYDQGYYYYNLHILDQTFGSFTENDYAARKKLPLNDFYGLSDVETPVLHDDGSLTYKVANPYDPYICFMLREGDYSLKDYEAFAVTVKSSLSSEADLFFICGNYDSFSAEQRYTFRIAADNKYHTYIIMFDSSKDMSGALKAFRLDAGTVAGEEIEISDISLIKLSRETPPVKLDRTLNVYPDKITESVLIRATRSTNAVSAMGMLTKIAADTVEKILVNDAAGSHSSLDEVDWDSAGSVGFDIKDAGIFGYILGWEEDIAGKLHVSLEDGYYVLTQERSLNGRSIKKNGSEMFAHTLYTDETHSFDGFIDAAEAEREPLEVTVIEENSSRKSTFLKYDSSIGAYMFEYTGIPNFDAGYGQPLKEHKVQFSITGGGKDRIVYLRNNEYAAGCLESAVVMDGNNMLLPIGMECAKNFGGDGEELFFTLGDSDPYGFSLFPAYIEAGQSSTFTIANLYEQWGNYRLKQVSSIRFHSAYYHMSLGVTETNCINLYSTMSRLPDHRGLSTVYWSDEQLDVVDANGNPTGEKTIYGQQPQHCNVGSHTFLQYTDSEGSFNSYENCGRTVISGAGPTYMDLTLNYMSFDGKVYQTYRHVEMPQTDENRGYYELDYVFLDDVTVNSCKDDFSIYAMTYNYDNFGYLNENNEPAIVSCNMNGYSYYKLGTEYPYFDCFHKTTKNLKAYIRDDASCNVACLIESSEITVGGKAYTKGFVVKQGNNTASLTLDLDGKVTFKKGDRIKIRMILMPWGDFFSEDDVNVRMVRVNTLQNPVKLEATAGTPGEDRIIPSVRSADGEAAEFTLSGGYPNVRDLPGYATSEYTKYKNTWERDYNITVKVGGLSKLGVPTVNELVNGSWQRYELASSLGYDGYSVEYAADGTFTYCFVVTMTEANARTFRLEVN